MTSLIHPTAVVHPSAQLHPSVEVGPYAVIGEHVSIGAQTKIAAHVIIDGWTRIGERNRIYPGAVIGLDPQDVRYDGATTWVRIGDDNIIREYVTIHRATGAGQATEIGNRTFLMANVHIAHNCRIEDHVIMANAVALAGHVHVETRAFVGGVLGVHQFVHIGRLAMVGGMSRIDRDVPPFTTVAGSPARVRGLNLVGMRRAGIAQENDGATLRELRSAFRALYRSRGAFRDAVETVAASGRSEAVRHLCGFLLASMRPGRRGSCPGAVRAGAKGEEE